MLSGWSPENENFASLEKFEAAKGGFCNLFLRRNFIQISSTGNLEDIIRKRRGTDSLEQKPTKHST